MARKITEEAVHAFMSARQFNKDNTSVSIESDTLIMRLHGNAIARREIGSNTILISNAGWDSRTTNERLNGLPGVSVCHKKGVLLLNGNAWDGEWTTI